MSYTDNRYSIKVRSSGSVDGHSEDGALESGCLVRIYDAGTRTASTIYADKVRTAKTNAITRTVFATDGGIEFYSPKTSHDIVVAYSDGTVGRFAGVTPNTHSVVLDRGSSDKVMIADFGPSDNVEVDTGLDFPYGAWIKDCLVEVVTNDATETLDVGLLSTESSGDANGFIAAIDVSLAPGFVATTTYTAGSNETSYLSATTYGALMGIRVVGADVVGDTGTLNIRGHRVLGTAAKSLTYTGSAGSDTAAGFIYCPFTQLL